MMLDTTVTHSKLVKNVEGVLFLSVSEHQRIVTCWEIVTEHIMVSHVALLKRHL